MLQVTPRLDAGGVEQTTLDIAQAVTRAGGRALVASQGGRLENELKRRGGALVRLPMDAKAPWTLLANAGRLGALIRREKVSLVHARSRAPAWSALWAARVTDTAFVTTYHGVYNARSSLKRGYNAVMAKGDLVIANSEFTRAHLLAEHQVDPDKVVAIPRGVDLSRFNPKLVSAARVAALKTAWGLGGGGETRLLLAGRLTRWKGQGLLIDALGRLLRQGRAGGLVLVLAGDEQGRTAYRAELERAAAAAGLAERVRIVGHCEDIAAAYLACDFAAAPSLEPEAFGRTAVEPQAMGRPVLAASHGAARETVLEGQTGWLVRPGDPCAWADALATAIATPPAQRAAMGKAGRARVKQLYSLKAMADETLAAYARVLRERGR